MITPFRTALLTAILPLALPGPALADVSHSIQGRFGVAYTQGPGAAGGQAEPLFEGRYTTTFDHQADNGMRFRFELGVMFGNLDPDRRPQSPFESRASAADRRN